MNKRFLIAATTVGFVVTASMPQAHAATFPDVQKGTEMGDAIYALANKQIINGYPDGQFKAHLSVTRGQMAKIIANTLQLDISKVENPGFEDVSKTHIFYPYIAALTSIGVFNSNAKKFNPDRPMTRAEVAKVLTVAFDLPSVGQHPFQDVNEQWSYYINALYSNGITKGTSPTAFDVNSPVTRGQLALFIVRLQSQLKQVQATFTSEQFNGEPISAMLVAGFGNEKTLYIETATDQSSITVRANDLGTAYVYIGSVDPDTNDWRDTPKLYQFTSAMVQGKLQLTSTIQSTPIYGAVQLPIYDSVGPFSLSYLNGEAVEKEALVIENKRNEFDGTQEQSIWLKSIYGELLATYTNNEGEVVQKAIFVEQKPYYLKATVGDYVTNSYTVSAEKLGQLGLTETFIDSKVFEGLTESSKVNVTLTNKEIEISPLAAGQFTIYLVDTQYRLHPISLNVLPFGKGYLLQLNE